MQESDPTIVCKQLYGMMLWVWGFAVPLSLMWYLEYNDRKQFQRESVCKKGKHTSEDNDRLPPATMIVYFFVCLIGSGISFYFDVEFLYFVLFAFSIYFLFKRLFLCPIY